MLEIKTRSKSNKTKTELNVGLINAKIKELQDTGWFCSSDKNANWELYFCLPAMLEAMSWKGNIMHICEALPYQSNSPDIIDFVNSMANLGYTNHHYNLDIHNIDTRLLPCLFVQFDNNGNRIGDAMVIFHKNDDGKFKFYSGKTKNIEESAFDQNLTGVAYFFHEIDLEESESILNLMSQSGIGWFRSLFTRFRKIFLQVFFSSLVVNLFALSVPLYVMIVYDKVVGVKSESTLYYLLFSIVAVLLTEYSLLTLRAKNINWFSIRIHSIVINNIFTRILFLPAKFTETSSVSSQISRIKSFESVKEFFSGHLFLSIIEIPFIVVLLAAIYFFAGILVLVPISIALIYVIILTILHKKMKFTMSVQGKKFAHKQQFYIDTFAKIHDFRQNGMVETWYNEIEELSGKSSVAGLKSSYMFSLLETISQSLASIAGISTLIFGVFAIWHHNISPGSLIATMILTWRILSPLQTLCSIMPRVEQIQNSIKQINKLMSLKTEHSLQISSDMLTNIEGNIKINQVGIRYTKDLDPIFLGLNLEASAGEMIAITGNNGTGKTTILKLIMGLYRPQAGMIYIDNVDIRQIDAIELRQYITYLPQIPEFFEGSIIDNLRLVAPTASNEMIKNALIRADLWEEINKLPKGINTLIGATNEDFYAGFAYKLNLARSYIKKSNIMLFDELPNSILNTNAGKMFKGTLNEYKGYHTIFLVTQRNDYIKLADKVIMLDKQTRPQVVSPGEYFKLSNW